MNKLDKSNKRNIFLLVFLIIIIFITGIISIGKINKKTGYIPPLNIIGDVEEVITLKDFNGNFDKKAIEKRGSGPYQIIIRKDQFSQRWAKYVLEIELQ